MRHISDDERADYQRQDADARFARKYRHSPATTPEDDGPDETPDESTND
jgi:hypothetical protein